MKRVLILSASAGTGHIRAAQAIEQAFKDKGDLYSVRHVDALKYTNLAFRKVYADAYIDMVNALPAILGLIYDFADEPWKDEKRRLAIDRLNTVPLVRMLNREKPDIVICTHFLPAEIISYLICKKQLKTSLSVVVTDLDIHAMWLCRHYSSYFVAIDETKEHINMMGFDRNRIIVSGIPIDPIFKEKKDKVAMRLKYGLNPDIPTIYMSSGGCGVGKAEEIIENLSHIQNKAQVLAMCGSNQNLKARLDNLQDKLPQDSNLKNVPVAYTTAVDEYMSASDMVLGKPGGLTTAEALSKELAFIIVNPIPGQEERNADHLLEKGIALRCNNLPALSYKVDLLLSDPDRLKAMSTNAGKLSKPDAARTIVNKVCDQSDQAIIQQGHICSSRLERFLSKTSRLQGEDLLKVV